MPGVLLEVWEALILNGVYLAPTHKNKFAAAFDTGERAIVGQVCCAAKSGAAANNRKHPSFKRMAILLIDIDVYLLHVIRARHSGRGTGAPFHRDGDQFLFLVWFGVYYYAVANL